jgi:hypothetical protein
MFNPFIGLRSMPQACLRSARDPARTAICVADHGEECVRGSIGTSGRPIEVLLVKYSPGDVHLTQEAFEALVKSTNDFWLTAVHLPPKETAA